MLAQDDMVVRPVIAVISGIAVILWYWGRIAESRIEKPHKGVDSITTSTRKIPAAISWGFSLLERYLKPKSDHAATGRQPG